jgi:hypothetical protein
VRLPQDGEGAPGTLQLIARSKTSLACANDQRINSWVHIAIFSNYIDIHRCIVAQYTGHIEDCQYSCGRIEGCRKLRADARPVNNWGYMGK